MQDYATMDETDLALVHALQLQPRVTWAHLADVLDVDASTLARRWTRLSRAGLAWFSSYPRRTAEWSGHGWGAAAFVEVECLPGRRKPVMDVLARNPAVLNIDATSGRRDLMLTMTAPSIVALDQEVDSAVATIADVRRTRTHYFRSVIREGSTWRLNALSPEQQRALATPSTHDGSSPPGPRDLGVLRILGPDARTPAVTVAEQLGCSEATAGRWIRRVLDSPFTATRCEVAHNVAGWEVAATLWLDVPQHDLKSVGSAISRLREIRLCVTVSSEANLVAQIWLHRLGHLDQFEMLLATRFPGTRILDRWVTPRFGKRLGHLIDPDGRRTDYVPILR
jgi:DNA-binding Lrp family transcriptional regulator